MNITPVSNKERILFIDVLRAFAVFMMVQGHTIDVFLRKDYRDDVYILYYLWNFMRGITAPIFMFSAGTVFSYLFKAKNKPYNENPRAKKGIKRFFILLFFGYLLRYPDRAIVYFHTIKPEQWKTFFAVDVLQLIGFSILTLVFLEYIAEKFRWNIYKVFSISALVFFLGNIVVANIKWADFIPLPIADYLYNGMGSNFPIFPWCGFVITGGLLGNYLANNPGIYRKKNFFTNLFKIGSILILIGGVGDIVELFVLGKSYFWSFSPNLIFVRIGLVLYLTTAISYLSTKIKKLPRLVVLLGQNTLLIYFVHVIILYGSAWNPGLVNYYDKAFNVGNSILAAVSMLLLMSLMVWCLDKFKKKYTGKNLKNA